MNNERLMPILFISCFVTFAAGYCIGAYPREQPTPTLPANYNPALSDAMATSRAQQDSLTKCYAAIESLARPISH